MREGMLRPEIKRSTHDKIADYAQEHGLQIWKAYDEAVKALKEKEEINKKVAC